MTLTGSAREGAPVLGRFPNLSRALLSPLPVSRRTSHGETLTQFIPFAISHEVDGPVHTLMLAPDCVIPPRETRALAFWDVTQSITPLARAGARDKLREITVPFGEKSWPGSSYDEIVIIPIHARTKTASAVLRQRFDFGEFADGKRRMQRAAFKQATESLDARLQFERGVLQHTDVLGSIDRIIQEFGADTSRIRVVWYFSDMMESMSTLDFENARTRLTSSTVDSLVDSIVARRAWSRGAMAGVNVHVRVPGTVSGSTITVSSDRAQAVEQFWRALFGKLGARVDTWVQL